MAYHALLSESQYQLSEDVSKLRECVNVLLDEIEPYERPAYGRNPNDWYLSN